MADRNQQQPLVSQAERLFFQIADPEVLGAAVAKPKNRKSPISIGQGVLYDPQTGESFIPDVYQQQQAWRDEVQLNLLNEAARQRAQQYQQGQEVKQVQAARAPEKVFQQSQESEVMADSAAALAQEVQDLINQGKGVRSFIGESAMEMFGESLGGAPHEAVRRMTFSPDERNVRAKLADFAVRLQQAKLKGTLSDQDMRRLAASDPNEPRISDLEVLERLKSSERILREAAQSSMAGRQPPAGARPMSNLSGDSGASGPARIRAISAQYQRPEGVSDEAWAAWLAEQEQ